MNRAPCLADDLCCPACSYYYRTELFNYKTGPTGFTEFNDVVLILRKHVKEAHPTQQLQYAVKPVTYMRMIDTWKDSMVVE